MSIDSVKQAIALVKSYPDLADFEGPKEIEVISLAEDYLSLKFPPSYRFFLSNLGCGDFGGHEVYGIITSNFQQSSVPDAIWLTAEERSNSQLSDALLVIGDTGDGGYIVINTKEFSGEDRLENNVMLRYPDNHLEFLAPNFGDYFLRVITDVLG